jgi:hypothetical protein
MACRALVGCPSPLPALDKSRLGARHHALLEVRDPKLRVPGPVLVCVLSSLIHASDAVQRRRQSQGESGRRGSVPDATGHKA